ncbi:MAG: hypothetical protein LBU66_01345 [Treponema sp.]|jgi:hypothetical protein|nr:hypothetical protein [Treponema sp.]
MGDGNIDPMGNEMYNVGGGGDIGFEIDLSSVWANPIGLGYTIGVEGGMTINPFQDDDEMNVNFYSAGGVLGLYYFPLSRLFIRADGAAGVYQTVTGLGNDDASLSIPGFFWRGGGELGFRFTPGFLLAANAGWRQYHESNGRLFYSGLYTGLTAQVTFHTGTGLRDTVGASFDQHDPLYPVFMQLYQSLPLGDIVIRNNENAEIRNVQVFFRAGNYSASEYPCGSVAMIPRGRSVELPLFADFSPEILKFTDNGRVLGEVVIRYRFLGQQREAVRAVTVSVNNRNAVTAGDAAAFAAFISPTSPEVLDFARFIAGLERANRRTGHNTNFQYALWLLEGLRSSGIRLGKTYFNETEAQFPAETLLFGTGSSRDLALLVAGALEGVGIPSAFIETDDDFLVAVNLGINSNAAQTLFNGTDKIMIIQNTVWLPLSMTVFNDGFIECWNKGAAVLDEVVKENLFADFVVVSEAWSTYPPAPLPEQERSILRADSAAVVREAGRAMQTYINQEINPLIQRTSNNPQGLSAMALQNRMGILYMRAGRVSDGKAAYERAAGMGSVPAMTNRGNLALTENDFETAQRWFNQALQRDSQNSEALRGLEKISGR